MAHNTTLHSAASEPLSVPSFHTYPTHTTDTASCRITLNREHIHLESHQLIWLDSNAHDISHNDTVVTLTNLRKIVDYSKFYNDKEECIKYIEETSNTMTFLV